MQITVKGKGLDIGDALRAHVTDSLNDHLKRYYDRSLDVHVTVSKQASAFNVDLAVHVPGDVLAAHADSEDPYGAYDLASDKLFAQVKKHKSRLRDHHGESRDGVLAEVSKSA